MIKLLFTVLLVAPTLFAGPVQKDSCQILISTLASTYASTCSDGYVGAMYPSFDGASLRFAALTLLVQPTLADDQAIKDYAISCNRKLLQVSYIQISDRKTVVQKLQVLDSGSLAVMNSLDSVATSCTLMPE